MKKYCTKCGKPFEATGREVICPACKESAAEAAKRAAVLKAKRASWTGESVPVRISGRASTVIRKYGTAHNLPFAAALDDLLRSSMFFKGLVLTWEEVTPYKSRRMKQDAQDAPQDVQAVQEATGKAAAKTVKAAGKAAAKAAKTNKAGKATSKTANKK